MLILSFWAQKRASEMALAILTSAISNDLFESQSFEQIGRKYNISWSSKKGETNGENGRENAEGGKRVYKRGGSGLINKMEKAYKRGGNGLINEEGTGL